MSELTALLTRIAKHERVLTSEEWAADNLAIFRDTVQEALTHLLAQNAYCAECSGLTGQAATDFMADHIGTVSPIDPIGQSDLPALIQAALVADHRKGAV